MSNVNPDLTLSGGPGKNGANEVSNVNPDLTVSGGPGKNGANEVSNVNPDLTVSGGPGKNGANEVSNVRSEEHTSELQSLMRISYAVFCLKKKIQHKQEASKHQKHNYKQK